MGSYVWVRIKKPKDQTNLEGFYAARFGWRLYRTFFETYTEKVWGVPVRERQADWGAQRVKNLSLFRAGWEAIKPKWLRARQDKAKQVTSLIEEFNYPKYGPGMMWERCAEIVTERGSTVHMNTAVTKIRHEGGRAVSVDRRPGPGRSPRRRGAAGGLGDAPAGLGGRHGAGARGAARVPGPATHPWPSAGCGLAGRRADGRLLGGRPAAAAGPVARGPRHHARVALDPPLARGRP